MVHGHVVPAYRKQACGMPLQFQGVQGTLQSLEAVRLASYTCHARKSKVTSSVVS